MPTQEQTKKVWLTDQDGRPTREIVLVTVQTSRRTLTPLAIVLIVVVAIVFAGTVDAWAREETTTYGASK